MQITSSLKASVTKFQTEIESASSLGDVAKDLDTSLAKLKFTSTSTLNALKKVQVLAKDFTPNFLDVGPFNNVIQVVSGDNTVVVQIPDGRYYFESITPGRGTLDTVINHQFECYGLDIRIAFDQNAQKLYFFVKDDEEEVAPILYSVNPSVEDSLFSALHYLDVDVLDNSPHQVTTSVDNGGAYELIFNHEKTAVDVYLALIRGLALYIQFPSDLQRITKDNARIVSLQGNILKLHLSTPHAEFSAPIMVFTTALAVQHKPPPFLLTLVWTSVSPDDQPLEKKVHYYKMFDAIYQNYEFNSMGNYYPVEIESMHRVGVEDDGRIKLRMTIIYRSVHTHVTPAGGDKINDLSTEWGADFRYGWATLNHEDESVTFEFDRGTPTEQAAEQPPGSSGAWAAQPGFVTQAHASLKDKSGEEVYADFTKIRVAPLPWMSVINASFLRRWEYKYDDGMLFDKYKGVQVVDWVGDPRSETCHVKLRMVVQYLDMDAWDCHANLLFPTQAQKDHCDATQAAATHEKHFRVTFKFGPNPNGLPNTAHFDYDSLCVEEDEITNWQETAIPVWNWDRYNIVQAPEADGTG